MSEYSSMAEGAGNLSFARLVPTNERARLAFADAVDEIQRRGNEHQLRFYKKGYHGLTTSAQPHHEESNSSSGFEAAPLLNTQSVFADLTLSTSGLPRFPRLGWRVGHLERSVDIQIFLAERRSGNESTEDRAVDNFEFRLFVHPRSGLLCLQRSAKGLPLSYADRAQRLIPLDPRETIILLSPITKVVLSSYEFQVEYTVSEASFFTKLNEFLEDNHKTSLHAKGRIYPSIGFPSFCGRYLVGGHLGSGTFGDVCYGVDSKSGDPVALKSIRLQNSGWRRETTNEIMLLEELKGLPNCLQLLASWCQHHEVHPKDCPGDKEKEVFYLVTDIALFDFKDPGFMRDLALAKVLELSRHVLLAIRDLHQKGIMHRDVTLSNCFVVGPEPLRAVLGDFGKAVRATEHTQTSVGPVPTCAPEVWSGRYTNAIDLWSWAYMMAQCLGYVPASADYARAITRRRLAQIIAFLQVKSGRRSEPQGVLLVDLLTRILVWDPDRRLTVSQALDHDVWETLPAVMWGDETDADDTPLAKRYKAGSSAESKVESLKTVPFSEEP